MMVINIDRTFHVEKASSAYPSVGTYSREAYSFDCSPNVIGRGKNFYEFIEILTGMIQRGELPEDTSFMSQHQGFVIEKSYLRRGRNPRNAIEFMDYFGKNDEMCHLSEWTSTGLRVPKGWENKKYQTNKKVLQCPLEKPVYY